MIAFVRQVYKLLFVHIIEGGPFSFVDDASFPEVFQSKPKMIFAARTCNFSNSSNKVFPQDPHIKIPYIQKTVSRKCTNCSPRAGGRKIQKFSGPPTILHTIPHEFLKNALHSVSDVTDVYIIYCLIFISRQIYF